MPGLLISCCNTGIGTGPFHLAYQDLDTGEFSWIRLDHDELAQHGVNLSRVSGATGLYAKGDRYWVGLQGLHRPAFILEFDAAFDLRRVLTLPGVSDMHSIRVYGDHLYTASTGSDEIHELDLTNPASTRVVSRLPETIHASNTHLNDYIRFEGKEYVLGHTNPFTGRAKKSGFVHCITDNAVVLEGLEHPHTLMILDGKLAVLDSARARVIFVGDGAEHPWVQLPSGGVLRGACQSESEIFFGVSSRRIFSRKQGIAKLNVDKSTPIFENEPFMSWLYRCDKADPTKFTRTSFSEIAFEIYDILLLEDVVPEAKLVRNAAAIRAQSYRQKIFALTRHAAKSGGVDESEVGEGVVANIVPAPLSSTGATAPQTAREIKTLKQQDFGSVENYYVSKGEASKKTIIAFAGLAQLIAGMVPYNFKKSLEDIDANVVFVRDPKRTWYNGPIQGLGDHFSGIGARLQEVVEELDTQELYLVGASSGGFAALAFAPILKPKRVLAFSPQTSIDLDYLRSQEETRWLRPIAQIPSPYVVDVLSSLKEIKHKCAYDVIVGSRVPRDVVYADRLKEVKNATVHYVDSQHNTAEYLKGRGMLTSTLRRFIDGDALNLDSSE